MSDMNETPDSNDENGEVFWELIDSFIDLANDHVKAGKGDSVSAAMSYAAARFNAFVVAASASDADALKADREKAVEFFVERFKNMLDDNLNEYIENFNEYTEPLEGQEN